MISIANKQILIDGEPQILMCGEIHYYRLSRDDWQDRLDKLKAAGCNVVASYVPWLCHEPEEGQFDLEGTTRPELNLRGFIDLCHQNGLLFFVRPGPFIMAEMKNEGLPYWVYRKHPEIIPISWDGKTATTKTVDYLAPGFLEEVRRWYRAVMNIVKQRLYQNGGNIIGVQLDNEIGMLSWVSNGPDLTDHVIAEFAVWLSNQYGSDTLASRYPFDMDDFQARVVGIRSPREEYAPKLMRDLGHFMRYRFAKYVSTLRSYAEEFGVKDIPFVINIHGTGGGRGFTFPIGISQLYQAYTQESGYISGSDIYLGDLTVDNFQDLYLINGFMDAVHTQHQPLASVEFECGDGNYGNTYGARYDVSAADFKTRMCIAQGHKMINYYLFAGGRNYRIVPAPNDGNDRVAFTGERHGFAAPVGPEGHLNYTYPRMARTIQTVQAVAAKLAVMEEQHDNISFGFIPDYFMTEYRYPGSKGMREIIENLESNRAFHAWEVMARALLFCGYRFGAVDIQNKTLNPHDTPVLALPSARYMSADIQRKIVNYLTSGGALFLYGEVPQCDMEGEPCSILADTLRVSSIAYRQASEQYFLSVVPDNWAVPRPEVRTHRAQVFYPEGGTVILRTYDTREACGLDMPVGNGRAIIVTTAYECDVPFFRLAMEKLGAKAELKHDCPDYGIFMTSTASKTGERFIHVLNLDGFDKMVHITDHGHRLFDGREILIQGKEAIMLPLNVAFHDVTIFCSTAEILNIHEDSIEFRLTQPEDVIMLRTNRAVVPSDDFVITPMDDALLIVSRKHAKINDQLTIHFAPRSVVPKE